VGVWEVGAPQMFLLTLLSAGGEVGSMMHLVYEEARIPQADKVEEYGKEEYIAAGRLGNICGAGEERSPCLHWPRVMGRGKTGECRLELDCELRQSHRP
jgi:hypothetical protein